MDNSSALPAAAAAHLGAMARVPAAALPIDFSPGNSGDFAALLAAQPAPARAPAAAPIARSAAGNDGGRGGSLPDSGKGLPAGGPADRAAGAADSESRSAVRDATAAKGSDAADARREARAAAAADRADDEDAADAEAGEEVEGECVAEARNARLARARLEAAASGVGDPVPLVPTETAAGTALAALAATTAAAGDAVAVADPTTGGGTCADGEPALAAATAAATDGAVRTDAPLRGAQGASPDSALGRMLAAARESAAAKATDAAAGSPLAEAAAPDERVPTAAAASLATTGAPLAAGTGEGEALRARHESKAAPGSVRLDGPVIGGSDTAPAADSGGAAARQGHRESPPSPALPARAAAAAEAALDNRTTAPTSAAGAAPTPAATPAPPAGLSALAANAAVAAMRGAVAGGRGRGEGSADGALTAATSVAAATTDITTSAPVSSGASVASPTGLLAGLAPPPGSAVNSPRAAVEVQAAPGTPAFADELATRVAVLVQQDAGGATLKLNPGHLGPVEVRVQVRDGEATVMFAAHHATTREALEGAAPRLRELLGQQGYTQVNVDVAAQGQDLAQRQAAWNQARADGGAGRDGRGPWREPAAAAAEVGGLRPAGTRAAARGVGRLDAFA